MYLVFQLLFFLFFIHSNIYSFQIKLIKSPVFPAIPFSIKHHSLLLSSKNISTEAVYFVDFTPVINKGVMSIYFSLLLGKTVPAKIRIRMVKPVNFFDTHAIEESMYIFDIASQDIINHTISRDFTKQINDEIIDSPIKDFIYTIVNRFNNNFTMSLYNYNCQHFSRKSLEYLGR